MKVKFTTKVAWPNEFPLSATVVSRPAGFERDIWKASDTSEYAHYIIKYAPKVAAYRIRIIYQNLKTGCPFPGVTCCMYI